MEADRVRRLRLADPYKAFSLPTKAGEQLPVERPYWIAVAPNGSQVAYSPRTGGVRFIRLEDVTDAVVDEALTSPSRR